MQGHGRTVWERRGDEANHIRNSISRQAQATQSGRSALYSVFRSLDLSLVQWVVRARSSPTVPFKIPSARSSRIPIECGSLQESCAVAKDRRGRHLDVAFSLTVESAVARRESLSWLRKRYAPGALGRMRSAVARAHRPIHTRGQRGNQERDEQQGNHSMS